MVKEKGIVLYVGLPGKGFAEQYIDFCKKNKLEFACIFDTKKEKITESRKEALKIIKNSLSVDLCSEESISKALIPFEHRLQAVVARGDSRIPELQRVIPHVPYLKTPSIKSLEWATNKIQMRRRFALYNKKMTPKYRVVNDASKKTVKEVEEKIGFPLVVKPSGLAQSRLVNICYHHEELEETLKKVFRKLNKVHKEVQGRGEPQILVEQFMEGLMYSVDAYVNSRGRVYFCPVVSVKTGREIGFDDFFAYQTIVPTKLRKENIEKAQKVSRDAIHALGLRSVSAHVELLKTEQGWRIIEVGPRVGGFRDEMYHLSFGIDHLANDVFIRMGKKPIIPQKVKGYSAVLKFFAKKEGKITKINGIKKLQGLKSFHKLNQHKKVGDRAIYAKHGGDSIFNVYLFNESRSFLLADIRRMEKFVKIETE